MPNRAGVFCDSEYYLPYRHGLILYVDNGQYDAIFQKPPILKMNGTYATGQWGNGNQTIYNKEYDKVYYGWMRVTHNNTSYSTMVLYKNGVEIATTQDTGWIPMSLGPNDTLSYYGFVYAGVSVQFLVPDI